MTFTELKYMVSLAQHSHFGRAAKACFVSQPTLSVAITKLEKKLNVHVFERGHHTVRLTDIGKIIVAQAKRTLEEADKIMDLGNEGKCQLKTPLRLGAIYSVGPHLYPLLIPNLQTKAPHMQLIIQEDYTEHLLDKLKQGELDVIFIGKPTPEAGLVFQTLYTEPLWCLLPSTHRLSQEKAIAPKELSQENIILPGEKHCLRDMIIQILPKGFEHTSNQVNIAGTSLSTIKGMVECGIGLTVLPSSALATKLQKSVVVKPFKGTTATREIALVWRTSFPRTKAIDVVIQTLKDCRLHGVCFTG